MSFEDSGMSLDADDLTVRQALGQLENTLLLIVIISAALSGWKSNPEILHTKFGIHWIQQIDRASVVSYTRPALE